MEGIVLSEISNRIKQYRLQNNLTIQELADLSHVSKGMVSQIENGRSIPSLPVLINIVDSLGIPLSVFFNDIQQKEELVIVGKKDSYESFEKEGTAGFSYLRFLTKTLKASTIDIVLLTLEPENYRDKVTTDAFEYKYIISGSCEYHIGDHIYSLEAGDSLFFDGRIQHVPVNKSNIPCTMLIIYFFEVK